MGDQMSQLRPREADPAGTHAGAGQICTDTHLPWRGKPTAEPIDTTVLTVRHHNLQLHTSDSGTVAVAEAGCSVEFCVLVRCGRAKPVGSEPIPRFHRPGPGATGATTCRGDNRIHHHVERSAPKLGAVDAANRSAVLSQTNADIVS